MKMTQSITVHSPDDDQRVTVTGDGETLAAVAALCRPWLTVTDGCDLGAPVIITGMAHAEPRDRELIQNSPDDEPPRRLLVSHAAREIVIDAPDPEWRVMQVLRGLRHVLRWQCYGPETLFLHAGMVSFDGVGVAYVGSKKAGKTSSLIAALLAGADFVVNDDLTVRVGPDGLTGYGWPRTTAIRRDTVLTLRDRLPGFPRTSRELRHPANRWNASAEPTVDGLAPLLWVDPAELATAAKVELRACAPIGAVVLPGWDDAVDRPRWERLSPATARELLAPHVESRAVSYDPFLAAWFDTEPVDEVLAELVESVPIFRLRQRMDLLQVSAEQTRRLLTTESDTCLD